MTAALSSPEKPADTTRAVVLLLTIASFASSMSMRVCDPLLPQLAQDFEVSVPKAAGTITGFAVSYGVLQLVIGPLGDRLGKYRVVNAAVALAAVASLACALAPSLYWLIFARVLAGGVGGAINPVAFAWVGDEMPYEQRQPVLARVMSGALLGVILGQLVGGVFADTIGWRWAFVTLAAMFAAVALLMRLSPAARVAPRMAPQGQRMGLVGLWRGYAAIARPAWSRTVLLAVLAEGMLMYGALSFVPTALHQRFDLPMWQAASAAAIVGLGGFIYTTLARRLIGGLGERGLALLGGALVSLGLLALALAPAPWVAMLGALSLGLGFYSFHNVLQVHGTQLSATQRGMGMALFALCLFVGQSVGVALASVVVALAGFQETFVVAALAFGGLTWAVARALARPAPAAPAGGPGSGA